MKRFTAFSPISKSLDSPPDCWQGEQTGKIKKFSLRLPKRPLFTVVVVNSGQNTPPQSLYWWSKPVYPQTRAAEESGSFLKEFYHGAKSAYLRFCPFNNLVESTIPQPCSCALSGEKGGQQKKKCQHTPPLPCGQTRMTEEEYADFTERLKHYDMSQAEFIRQAITRATIRPIVTVSPVNDELLSAVGRLTAEYGKIGGNLNQIARALNEYGTPYNALSVEVRAAISDLAALKFEVLRKVGDAVGNIQTYQL